MRREIDHKLNSVPYEIAKSKHQNRDTSELYHIVQVGIERLDQVGDHRRQGKWTHALNEGCTRCTGQGREFPKGIPILFLVSSIVSSDRSIRSCSNSGGLTNGS